MCGDGMEPRFASPLTEGSRDGAADARGRWRGRGPTDGDARSGVNRSEVRGWWRTADCCTAVPPAALRAGAPGQMPGGTPDWGGQAQSERGLWASDGALVEPEEAVSKEPLAFALPPCISRLRRKRRPPGPGVIS